MIYPRDSKRRKEFQEELKTGNGKSYNSAPNIRGFQEMIESAVLNAYERGYYDACQDVEDQAKAIVDATTQPTKFL